MIKINGYFILIIIIIIIIIVIIIIITFILILHQYFISILMFPEVYPVEQHPFGPNVILRNTFT